MTALVPKHKGVLVDLRIEGELQTLRPSVAHPFWVKRSESDAGHWITAANLRTGELVATLDGSWRKIESVQHDEGQETVYNFTVDKDHDYFVGQTGFLVHNQNCWCKPGQELHHIVPENMEGFEPALGVLERAGIDVNDLDNLMPIDYFLHRRIHTDAYRNWVNNTLRDAESLGDNISCTLSGIGGAINNGTAVF